MPTFRSLRLAHPLLRTSSAISFHRSGNTTILPAIVTPLNLRVRLMTTSGYGDQGGDPVSDNPQKQGPRPRIDTEHPGPEPVAEGKGKGGVKGHSAAEETKGMMGGQETANKRTSESNSERKNSARSKISNESQPRGNESSETQAHNKNMQERGHSEVAKDDHVAGKGYWQGNSS